MPRRPESDTYPETCGRFDYQTACDRIAGRRTASVHVRTGSTAGVITVYKDKSFDFITKVPPVAVLIKKAIKIQKGSGKPNMEKVAKITKAQVKEIAEQKMPDLNAASIETAMSMVEGTARSMGVVVID